MQSPQKLDVLESDYFSSYRHAGALCFHSLFYAFLSLFPGISNQVPKVSFSQHLKTQAYEG